MKFSINDFSSECDQIRRKLRIWSPLLEKSLMENYIFVQCVYITKVSMLSFSTENPLKSATLQNLDRFLLQSKILSVTKINKHMPIP